MSAAQPSALMTEVGVFYLDRGYAGIVTGFDHSNIFAVIYDQPMRCITLQRDAQLRPVLHKGVPYPIGRCARMMLACGLSIQDAARTALEEILKAHPEEIVPGDNLEVA